MSLFLIPTDYEDSLSHSERVDSGLPGQPSRRTPVLRVGTVTLLMVSTVIPRYSLTQLDSVYYELETECRMI